MKYSDFSWDFRNENTKRFTHCYHIYPAMMIPQVAERIVSKYGNNARLLFDPYCGTGTSLVEANALGIEAIGTDLNPLARLIAQTKTAVIDIQILDLYLKEFNDYIFSIAFDIQKINVVVPEIKNIDFWFDKSVQDKLAEIKYFISSISESNVANFFKVAFSETVRESSWTRNSEFKLFRMTEEQMQKFSPDVFGIMQSKLARNHKGLKSFLQTSARNATSQIFDFNTTIGIQNIEPESVDIVVTSPPYGDSRTTVAYGQFSRLANEWLDVQNANQVDNLLMGGVTQKQNHHFESVILNENIEKIAEIDEKRAKEVSSFYVDYQKSIQNVATTLRKGGFACYVVGNRKVKGITLPTDEITREFFESQGFEHHETIIRNIPNKRMPSKNSPSNVIGEKDNTMVSEFIVIMQKA